MLQEEFSNINQTHKSILSVNGLDIEDAPFWLPKASFSRTDTEWTLPSGKGA